MRRFRRPPTVGTPRSSAPAKRQHLAELAIAIVDDPEGLMRLVGARGTLNSVTIVDLLDVLDGFNDDKGLHLDLSATTIRGTDPIEQLESMIDELELRGIKLRVIGVDPAHPALAPQTHR